MEIIKFLQQFHNPFLDSLFINITKLAEVYFFIVVLSIIFWCINKKARYKIGFVLLSSNIVNGAVKCIVNAKRPFQVSKDIRALRTETATGSSFPSGHTQGTAAFWTAMMIWIRKLWVYILGALLIVLVAISRMYLGVHWPRDVAAGAAIGIAWAFFAAWLFDFCQKKNNRLIMLIILIPSFIGLIFFHSADYINSVGVFTGFYIGYVIEDKYINFETKTTILKQILKVIIGLAGTIIIVFLLGKLLPSGSLFSALDYMVMGIWIAAGAPFIFKRIS